MLENDLVLSRFLARRGASLTHADVIALDALLDLPDNDLWQLISGQVEAPRPELRPLVAELRTA
jgi:succinate dehydrogenase flavin-adding protein (antitoxin of CptAB toxin-antitoxin module)